MSVGVAVAGVVAPQRFLLFSAPHGLANMAAAVQGPAPLSYLLPTFTEGGIRAPLSQLAPWVVAALLALAIIALVYTLARSSGRLRAVAAGIVVFVVSGAVLAGAPAASSQQAAIALTGRLELMRALDGPSMRGFDYSISRRLSAGSPARAEHGARVARGWGLVDGSGAARGAVRSAARTLRRAYADRRA